MTNSNEVVTSDTEKYAQQIQALNASLDKSKKQTQDAREKNVQLEKSLHDLNKEHKLLKNSKQQVERDSKNSQVRLDRLISELERQKATIRDLTSNEGENASNLRREIDRLQQETKTLKRQKTELITAFKKQLKLIDILKRQKIHLESSRLLQFTEEEFLKTLDMGERM